jgi:hypothetical protein
MDEDENIWQFVEEKADAIERFPQAAFRRIGFSSRHRRRPRAGNTSIP